MKKHERRKHWSFKSEASYFFPKPPSLPLGFWRCLQFPKQPSTILNPTRYIHSHSHLSLFGCSESKRKARKRREKERLLFFFSFTVQVQNPGIFWIFYLEIISFIDRISFVFCLVAEKIEGKSGVFVSAEYTKTWVFFFLSCFILFLKFEFRLFSSGFSATKQGSFDFEILTSDAGCWLLRRCRKREGKIHFWIFDFSWSEYETLEGFLDWVHCSYLNQLRF